MKQAGKYVSLALEAFLFLFRLFYHKIENKD